MTMQLTMHSLHKRKALTALLEKKWDAEKHLALQDYQKILRYRQFREEEWGSLFSRMAGLQADIEQHYGKTRLDAVYYQSGLALMQDMTVQMDAILAELEKLDRQLDEKKKQLAMLDARTRYYADYHEAVTVKLNLQLLRQEQYQAMEQYVSFQYARNGAV